MAEQRRPQAVSQIALGKLPEDVLREITEHMSKPTLLRFSQTSKALRAAALQTLFNSLSISFGDLRRLDSSLDIVAAETWKEVKEITLVLDDATVHLADYHQRTQIVNRWEMFLRVARPVKLVVRSELTDPHDVWHFLRSPARESLQKILGIYHQRSLSVRNASVTLDFMDLAIHYDSCIWQELMSLKECVPGTTLRIQVRGEIDSNEEDEMGDQDLNTATDVDLADYFSRDFRSCLHLKLYVNRPGLEVFLRGHNGSLNLTVFHADLNSSSDFEHLGKILHCARRTLVDFVLYMWYMPDPPSNNPVGMEALRSVTLINVMGDRPRGTGNLLRWFSNPALQRIRLHDFLVKLKADGVSRAQDWITEVTDAISGCTEAWAIFRDRFTVSKEADFAFLDTWDKFVTARQGSFQNRRFKVVLETHSYPTDLAKLNILLPRHVKDELQMLSVSDKNVYPFDVPDMATPSIRLPRLLDFKLEWKCSGNRSKHRLDYLLSHTDAPDLHSLTFNLTADLEQESSVDEHVDAIVDQLASFQTLAIVKLVRHHYVSDAACLSLRERCSMLGVAFEQNDIPKPQDHSPEPQGLFD